MDVTIDIYQFSTCPVAPVFHRITVSHITTIYLRHFQSLGHVLYIINIILIHHNILPTLRVRECCARIDATLYIYTHVYNTTLYISLAYNPLHVATTQPGWFSIVKTTTERIIY